MFTASRTTWIRLWAVLTFVGICLGLVVPAAAATPMDTGAPGVAAQAQTPPATPAEEPAPPEIPIPDILDAQGASAGLTVTIDGISPRIITHQDSFTISGTIRNDSEETVSAPSLTVGGSSTAYTTLAEIDEHFSGDSWLPQDLAQQTLDLDLPPGSATTFSLTISSDQAGLTDSTQWGPRGIEVTASAGGVEGSDPALVIWVPDTPKRSTTTSIVAPWTRSTTDASAIGTLASTSGVTIGIDPTVVPDILPSDTPNEDGADNPLENVLKALTGAGGDTTDSIQSASRALDRAQSQGWIDILKSGNEVIALPEYDADLGLGAKSSDRLFSLAAASRGNLQTRLADLNADLGALETFRSNSEKPITPQSGPENTPAQSGNGTGVNGSPPSNGNGAQSADSSTSAGGNEEPQSPPTNAENPHDAGTAPDSAPSSDTPQSGSVASPNLPQSAPRASARGGLIPAGVPVREDVVWSSDSFGLPLLQRLPGDIHMATAGQVRPVEDLGFISVSRVEVDPSSGETVTPESPETGSESGEGSTDTATVLTSEESLIHLLAWNPPNPGLALDQQQILAALGAVIARQDDSGQQSLFLPLPRGIALDSGLAARANAVMSSPWVQPASISQLAASTATDVERTPVTEAPISQVATDALASLEQTLESAHALIAATEDPQAAMDSVEGTFLAPLATGTSDASRTGLVGRAEAEVDTLLHSVTVEPSVTINLINKSANFPVRIRNSLPWPVTVRVTLDPSDPRLSVVRPVDVTIPSESATTAEVPVAAIGSGDITVAYKVTTVDGFSLGDSDSVMVRMRAEWEDAATAVIAIVVAIAFVAGLARTIARRMKAKRASGDSLPKALLPGIGGGSADSLTRAEGASLGTPPPSESPHPSASPLGRSSPDESPPGDVTP
ncbi:MAG: DUF6049 family protein [Actinomycetaceae bacterium]|nr:DUF6049 family protein [Actinomycetaceae bacterium]